MYEITDHTADIGIKVESPTLDGLFVEAARAAFDIMVASKRDFIPSVKVPIAIKAPSLDQLLIRWLQELLFVFESRRLVLSKFWIDEIDEKHLFGAAKGLKFDSTRHTQKLEIKAVTYHNLEVKRQPGGNWSATIIFDI